MRLSSTRYNFDSFQIPSTLSYTIDMDAMRIERAANKDDEAKASKPPANPAVALARQEELSGWNFLAQAIDRILFCIYFFILIILMGCYIGGASTQ